ncbi:hypothetical protein [Pseudomonas viridiflava]|uniref:hypothetical protein n=1 Tax=Pseudomonas viridiflava TaxID=33069 RepID=UPI000F04E67F|nr:hypothetical protein [Pseudomonas viridiflava]
MDLYRITPHLNRAKSLLEKPDEPSMRYAALELRFAMETVVYRQLQQYGEVIPGSLTRMWKPDQILKLLISFDPTAGQGGELSFATNGPDELPQDFKPIGETKAIPWKEFRGFYNKLGSYLHVSPHKPDGKKSTTLTKEAFTKIIAGLEDCTTATAIFAFKAIISARCDCDNMLYVGQSEFNNDELTVCSNTKCNRLWQKRTTDDGQQVLDRVEVITFRCADCQAYIRVQPALIWQPIRCPNCPCSFKINLALSTATRIG